MSSSTMIPSDRRIDWSAAGVWYKGVQGIPTWPISGGTTLNVKSYGAYGDDSHDDTSAIKAAIAAASFGDVVYMPAGIYRATGISMKSGVVVRGAGAGSTIIRAMGSSGGNLFRLGTGTFGYDPSSNKNAVITGGATKGSVSLTVSSASGITFGDLCVVTELNDSSFVSQTSSNGTASWVDGWNDGGARARGQTVEITAINGTTVTISPPLYSDYVRTPWLTAGSGTAIDHAGVEDLQVYAMDRGMSTNFFFSKAKHCWVKNVYGNFVDGDHARIDWSLNCEIRHCWFDDAFVHSSGQYDNQVGLRYKTSGCLIVDNVFTRLHAGVVAEWGAAGNVIAYNYADDGYDDDAATGSRWMTMNVDGNHGAHPQFNLFEGNICPKFCIDSYWGTSSHALVLRNHFLGYASAHGPYSVRGTYTAPFNLTQDLGAIQIWEGQSKITAIGNVLGDETISGYTYKITNPASRSYAGKYLWVLGYSGSSDGGGRAILPNPALTLIDHGNYDYVNRAAIWDPGIPERDIPPSLFLPAKPGWFGSHNWPANGPDVAGYYSDIPAKARWNAYVASGKTNLNLIFQQN
jgi:hypothetical protein